MILYLFIYQLFMFTKTNTEWCRVPCEYKKQNLAVRVEESSKKPDYLAIKILYQGGQTEIVGVDVAQVNIYIYYILYVTLMYAKKIHQKTIINGLLITIRLDLHNGII